MGAGHLKIGDKIKQADGTIGFVANVINVQKTQEMFNLTVSEAHTYYVGNEGWLVHNQNTPCKIPSGPQTYTADLSNTTGRAAANRNKIIAALIEEDLPGIRFTFVPQYSPFIRTGIAQQGAGTQVDKLAFGSRATLIDTLIHEELHHRWWARGVPSPHHSYRGVESPADQRFCDTIDRYRRLKGW
ncbi:polymorphic toxin-type HINT domain-containing protein [Deinococcus multiflagellatus]|uniref:Polymorphic toxin-type HINT domain-containing protein n=1 Tax=Deinococcus multiflagellatus TaxID=1656887 RepID=A0ABW1ZRK2_9DEIO|nr:polymorphic toxin-type HINT domain-containing protein [Deinococcus multiflagellatus]MBZ9715041.1 HINT domain-containing protein [Deinococcus multiflagellatus]